MKTSGRGQFNRNLETVKADESVRENNINGVSPFNHPKANFDNVRKAPHVQLVDEKMSDNKTVKTTTKGTR